MAAFQRLIRANETGRETRVSNSSVGMAVRNFSAAPDVHERAEREKTKDKTSMLHSTSAPIHAGRERVRSFARGRIHGTQALPMPPCLNVVWTTISSIVDDDHDVDVVGDDYGNNGIESRAALFLVRIHSYLSIQLENDRVSGAVSLRIRKKKKPSANGHTSRAQTANGSRKIPTKKRRRRRNMK